MYARMLQLLSLLLKESRVRSPSQMRSTDVTIDVLRC